MGATKKRKHSSTSGASDKSGHLKAKKHRPSNEVCRQRENAALAAASTLVPASSGEPQIWNEFAESWPGLSGSEHGLAASFKSKKRDKKRRKKKKKTKKQSPDLLLLMPPTILNLASSTPKKSNRKWKNRGGGAHTDQLTTNNEPPVTISSIGTESKPVSKAGIFKRDQSQQQAAHVDPRNVACTQLARPPIKQWFNISQPQNSSELFTEPSEMSGDKSREDATTAHRATLHTGTSSHDVAGDLVPVRTMPSRYASAEVISYSSKATTATSGTVEGDLVGSALGTRSSIPSISNGMIQIKPVRGLWNVSLSDYSNKSMDVATTQKRFEDMSVAMQDDETDSTEDGEDYLNAEVSEFKCPKAESQANVISAQPISNESKENQIDEYDVTNSFEIQQHTADEDPRIFPKPPTNSKISPTLPNQHETAPQNLAEQQSNLAAGPAQSARETPKSRARVRLEDVTPEALYERSTKSSEPEEPRRATQLVEIGRYSFQDAHQEQVPGQTNINDSAQVSSEQRLLSTYSETTSHAKDPPGPQEGTAKQIPAKSAMFANMGLMSEASDRNHDGWSFDRGDDNINEIMHVESDLWKDIDEIANTILKVPEATASAEKCKLPSDQRSHPGAKDVLMLDGCRSRNSSNLAHAIGISSGENKEMADLDDEHESAENLMDSSINSCIIAGSQGFEDTGVTKSDVDISERRQQHGHSWDANQARRFQDEQSSYESSLSSFTSHVSARRRNSSSTASVDESDQHNRRDNPPQVIIPRYGKSLLKDPRRRMTGNTSTHFSTPKSHKHTSRLATDDDDDDDDDFEATGKPDTEGHALTVVGRNRSVARPPHQDEDLPLCDQSDHDVSTNARSNDETSCRQREQCPTNISTLAQLGLNNANEHATINDSKYDADKRIYVATTAQSASGTPRSKQKSTGKISEHFIDNRVDKYNTTASSRNIPAGTSAVPAPSINEKKFGIIQEDYWDQPFWLLVAVTLLNKTTGRAAIPVFKKIMHRYPTPQDLAQAKHEDVLALIQNLGLQNNRTKTLLKIAEIWAESPPVRGRLYRKKGYPNKDDGKAVDVAKIVEEDMEVCAGAIEIGHLYGCGAYAYDSWRIFCRDVLRGVAGDYNGKNAKTKDFEPEWKRVVPGDKELRACLRWMWLREGWVWNPEAGDKRRASEDEMERAIAGEMSIEDPQEQKFTTLAAGMQASPEKRGDRDDRVQETASVDDTPTKGSTMPAKETIVNQDDVRGEAEERNLGKEARSCLPTPVPQPRPERRRTPNRLAKIVRSDAVAEESVTPVRRAKRRVTTAASVEARPTSSRHGSDGQLESKSPEPMKEQIVAKSPIKKRNAKDVSDEYDVPPPRTVRRRSTRVSR